MWTVNKYDNLGRLAYTAEVEDDTPFMDQLTRFNEMLVVETFSTSSQSYPMEDTGYSRVYYHQASTTLLTVNYYDNYKFLDTQFLPSSTVSELQYKRRNSYGEKYEKTNGLLTGTRVYSESGGYTLTVFYYDEHGNIIQKRSTNSVGGYDHHYYRYSFDGNLRQYIHDHILPSGKIVPEYYAYTYDHANRPLLSGHSFIHELVQRLLSSKSYDELGRLKSKSINNNHETINYSYNLRGWLTGIDSPNFKEYLHYGSYNGSYNGNIDHLEWKVASEDFTHNYYFQYDGLNRLTEAQYGMVSPSVGFMSNAYGVVSSYDKHGNILHLSRQGLLLPIAPKSRVIGGVESGGGGSSGGGSSSDYYHGVIDDLTLTYLGNRLRNVTDVADVNPVYKDGMHFVDGSDALSEYVYDSNGNMIRDNNKHVKEISYNRLNLPYRVYVSTPTGSLLQPFQEKEDVSMYVYDALGTKLKSTYSTSKSYSMVIYSEIDYCGNYIYENDTLSKVLLPEGYISIDKSNVARYHYYLKDHQGNNRVVLSQSNVAEQVNHYYPFGALFGTSKSGNVQKYKFGGKELERVAGVDLYDFEARQYDAVLGRYTSMDPHCENYYSHSPYSYCNNNPINRVDPDGKDWFQNTLTGSIYYNSSYTRGDIGLIAGEGWEWLGYNGFFNGNDIGTIINGMPYISHYSTAKSLLPSFDLPIYTEAFFGGKSGENFMSTMGYDRKPLRADVHTHQDTYYFFEGLKTIEQTHTYEIIDRLYSTVYVPKGLSASYVKLGDYQTSKGEPFGWHLPGWTSDTWEKRLYRYDANKRYDINGYGRTFLSILADLVEIWFGK